MKKLLALLLMSAMLASMTACATVVIDRDQSEDEDEDKDDNKEETKARETDAQTTLSSTPTPGEPIIIPPKSERNEGTALKSFLADADTDIIVVETDIIVDMYPYDNYGNNDELSVVVQNNSSDTLANIFFTAVGVNENGELVDPCTERLEGVVKEPTYYKFYFSQDIRLTPGSQQEITLPVDASRFEEIIVYVEGARLTNGDEFRYTFVSDTDYFLLMAQHDAVFGENLDAMFANDREISSLIAIESADVFPLYITNRIEFYGTGDTLNNGELDITVQNRFDGEVTEFYVYVMRYDHVNKWQEPDAVSAVGSSRPAAVAKYSVHDISIGSGEYYTISIPTYGTGNETYKAIISSCMVDGEYNGNDTAKEWASFIINGSRTEPAAPDTDEPAAKDDTEAADTTCAGA